MNALSAHALELRLKIEAQLNLPVIWRIYLWIYRCLWKR